jgi:NAD(P)-dependent dehydrogenase (short-subunit alcohol dehydrogenase family)
VLDATSNELKSRHKDVEVLNVEMDTSKEESVESAIDQTVKKFGRLDIAINNAGIGGNSAQTEDQALTEWQRVMDVNVNGVWLCQRAEIRQMLKQEPLDAPPRGNRGVIVNTASMLGLVAASPVSRACAYAASKHGKIIEQLSLGLSSTNNLPCIQ